MHIKHLIRRIRQGRPPHADGIGLRDFAGTAWLNARSVIVDARAPQNAPAADRADIMTLFRVLLVAVIVASVQAAVAFVAPGIASASSLADGMYRFDFDGSKQTLDGKSNPVTPSSNVIAIRSACPSSGCVATAADTSIGATWLQPPYERAIVFRENRNQWVGTRWRMYTCNNTTTQGSETLSFQTKTDGTFVGVSTGLESPCGPIVTPFTATRVGDLPADVDVADPNTA